MSADLPFIPVSEPEIGDAERAYILDCLDTGWVSGEGPYVARFERALASRVGRRHGVAVANGSVALDAAFAALGLRAGDEVIMPTFTIISCAAAIVRAGGTPVTVDCDRRTWTMRPEEVAERIGPRTRAILLVHIYGLPVDADPILELARTYNLSVVEDAAEAIGQTYRGRPCGSLGDMSVFSFFSNKNVTTGEGGMLLADDDRLNKRCRELRNLCFGDKRRFMHEELGWNWRMSNLQAALGCGQLERLDAVCERKRQIGGWYAERLESLRSVHRPVASTEYAQNHYWVFGVVLDNSVPFEGDEAIRRLAAHGIGARPFFWPMHEQPALHSLGLLNRCQHPNAERVARRGFYLPSGVTLTEASVDRVCAALRRAIS
jgi:perosamine synthetase